jgi:hypothetical protein
MDSFPSHSFENLGPLREKLFQFSDTLTITKAAQIAREAFRGMKKGKKIIPKEMKNAIILMENIGGKLFSCLS